MDTTGSGVGTDEQILLRLNDDYIHSDQHGDVARYQEFLAEDFTASLPDLVFRNRKEFLDLIAQPRPFTGLTLLNVTVRVLGDVALLHGRVRYTTTHDGREREALYTDTYQRRDRQWMCVAGEVVAQGE
jgi:ketosteroid isomerase-like protein